MPCPVPAGVTAFEMFVELNVALLYRSGVQRRVLQRDARTRVSGGASSEHTARSTPNRGHPFVTAASRVSRRCHPSIPINK